MHKSIIHVSAALFVLSVGVGAWADDSSNTETKTERKAAKASASAKKGVNKAEAKADKAADKAEAKADEAADRASDSNEPAVPESSAPDKEKGESLTSWTEKKDPPPKSSRGSYEGSYAREKDDKRNRSGDGSVGEDAERAMASVERDAKDEGAARAARRARTEDPQGLSFAGQAGYGTGDGYGAGIGGRVGYTFNNRIYLGGHVSYHFGSSTTVLDTTAERKVWYTGPELGYDLSAGPFIVRPVVGFGLGVSSERLIGAEATDGRQDTARVRPFVAPGATLMYPIGNFFIGGDARGMFISDNSAVLLYGTAGYHL